MEAEAEAPRAVAAAAADSIPLTLRRVSERKHRAAPLAACLLRRARAGRGRGMRALLERMRTRHHAYASMHTAAGRSAAAHHQNFTVAILAIVLVTTLTTSALQELAPARWTTLASNAAIAVIGGLTAINNFLGYQGREKGHRSAKREHLRAADLIDIAIAVDDEDPLNSYDYSGVLGEIQGIHDSLKKTAGEIPAWVARKYPAYEAPWLLESPAARGAV